MSDFVELAILKAIGFRRQRICARFFFAESFGLAIAGAVIGIGTAFLVFT